MQKRTTHEPGIDIGYQTGYVENLESMSGISERTTTRILARPRSSAGSVSGHPPTSGRSGRAGRYSTLPSRRPRRLPGTVPSKRLLVALVAMLVIGALGAACSRKGGRTETPQPSKVNLSVQKFETVGVGARQKDEAISEQPKILEPITKYYDGTLFGIVFPNENFDAAFEGFTTTVSARAKTEHADLMTPREVASRLSGVLQQETATATISVFSPSPGSFTHAGVSAFVVARGELAGGSAVRIERSDFFLLERAPRGWTVISYECKQRIDTEDGASAKEGASA
jgi:hypothetical protein